MKYDRYNRHDSCCNMRTAELCCQVVSISLYRTMGRLLVTSIQQQQAAKRDIPSQFKSSSVRAKEEESHLFIVVIL